MTSDLICIYHGNCADGFGAAWAVWKRFPNAQFHAGVYGEPPPDVTNKKVIMVDFSYKPDVLNQLSEKAQSILILDHHKSAVESILSEKLIGIHPPVDMFNKYSGALTWERHLQNSYQDIAEGIYKAVVYTVFDMNRSGAMIAWNFFHPDKEPPQVLKHIQDRDLWKFELPNTREIQAALFSYPYEFEIWDKLIEGDVDNLIKEGSAIDRKHFKDIEELIKICKKEMTIGGHKVWGVNLPYTMASDACHSLCKLPLNDSLANFAASYYDTEKGRVFSLRSIGEFDVSEIAGLYGGGGHKNAAGFRIPYDYTIFKDLL